MILRGISSCLHGSRRNANNFKHRFKRVPYGSVLICTSRLRGYSSVGVEHGDSNSEQTVGRSVDRSFVTTHYIPDGRSFRFATVVVRSMKKGESPVRIWEQACALIGGNNSPTLAVAFVSKPTESALRTVQVLAAQLSATLSSVSAKPAPSGSSLSAPPLSGASDSETGRKTGSTTPTDDALYGAEHVPLIGCIMDDSGGEIEFSHGSGSRIVEVDSRGSRFRGSQQSVSQSVNGGLPEDYSILERGREGQEEDDHASRVGGFRMGSSVRAVDAADVQEVEDEDEEDGTVSDWETLCSEYGEEAVKVLDSRPDSENENDDDDEEEEGDCENGLAAEDQISKEDLVSFLNALVRHRSPLEDSGGGGDLRALDRDDRNAAGMQRAGGICARAATGGVLATELERCLNNSSELGTPQTQTQTQSVVGQRVFGSNGLFGDYEGSITVEPRTAGDKAAGVSGSDVGKEDADYKLILCVGHMPGAKAVAFHSSTTGLPRLPDLENAVLENNPHALLLGAPGFVFPDFIHRLASVFPASCRAGAFLSPLFLRKKNKWAREDVLKVNPLFIGDQIVTSGVVGLAISSKVKGLEVPVGAFAELARMSVGMPRIQGYIYLDEPISKNLFLPNNITLQNAFGSIKGSKVAPSSLLEQLNERLLKESAVPAQPEVSAVDRLASPAVELNASDDLVRSQLLSSHGAEDDFGVLDKLPLALLDSVLFPGWSRAFYIFEPCYRLMVRHCVEQGKPFGLSSIHSGSWTADTVGSGGIIGTLVNLKIHTFERDCRSYIIAQGVRRFKVIDERFWSEPGSFGLNMGQVQFFDDKECETAEEKQELLDLAKRAVSLCREVVVEAQSAPGLVKSAHDPRLASFAIGHVLNVPTRVKRRWLKMVNTKTRLLEQMTFLETKVSTKS